MNNFQIPKKFGFTNLVNILRSGNKEVRFEQTIKSMQQIKTFVDLTQKLKSLNPLQYRQVQLIIEHLKQQSKLKKYFKKENQDKNHIIEIGKQLELEMDLMNEIDEKDVPILNLLKLNFTSKEIATMILESQITLETHHTLHQIQEKINARNIRKHFKNTLLDQIDTLNFVSECNSDSSDFYRKTINSFNIKRNQIQSQGLSVNEKFELLKKYLSDKGIEIEKKEKVPHLRYSEYFSEQANKLIKSTIQKQIRQIHISTPKNSEVSSELLNPQMYHTNQVSKKLQRLGSNYQTSNGLSSTTLNSPKNNTQNQQLQLPLSKIKKQNTQEYGYIESLQIENTNRSNNQEQFIIQDVIQNQNNNIKKQQIINEQQKSLEKLREFQAKTKAVQTFYKIENKEFLGQMIQLEKCIKKPLKQHFNQFMKVGQDENDDNIETIGRRKTKTKKNVRLNKIFKSDLE